ncbi:PREDICTED: protein RST1 isoform X2 [Lupinus angustifolius]|uniref:protein RST1 isoform X2 n=1 Tax=Lupinus angustifolius TaxID=3871 RepID=UPI00092F4C84|nr:PREDICTED: protein RST1 isoform X2 [Lupinus angustifolius]
MDSYSPLFDKTKLPQPSLQRHAVISIFSKLRSSPKYLNADSEPGHHVITQCLNSPSSNVVDQSVREICRLVTDSVISVNRGLLELQSALEGSDPITVPVFVKGLGFLVRFDFQKNNALWQFNSPEAHPFVKVLSCRLEVQPELLQQVCLFMLQNKQLGMVKVCQFLRPLLNFSIIRLLVVESSLSSFTTQLVSSLASFCCSFPSESLPVFKLLIGCLKYLPQKTSDDYRKLIFVVEHMVEAYIVVLKSLAGRKSLITEAQECAVEFLETIFSLSTCLLCHPGGHEPIFELSKRLLSVQHDLGLRWVPRLSSTMVSLFMILVKSELEHEQISMLKLLLLILKWKYNNDDAISRSKSTSVEEILFVLPVINLMSSPSKSVKGLAIDFLFLLEKLLVKMIVVPTDKPVVEDGVHYLSTPGIIVSRTLRLLWYQDVESSSRISLLNFAPNGLSDGERMHGQSISWVSQVRRFCLSIIDQRKSSLPLTHFQEVFFNEMPSLLTAVIGVLLIHPSMGAAAVNSLSSMAMMDPKLGVPLLLTIMFYSNIFIRKDVVRHDMLLKIFEMLPSLASHSAMVPLVVQTILPMLYKDAKVSLYPTATRLLCWTWETNDRAFTSLQGVLLPKGFTDFKSDIAICISMAASIRDVCRKSPDRGVDLILSVSSCIESKDPVIKALGLQSLTHLCEADVIDFYTAWDVIAKHLQGYHADPIIAHSICLLLRWGAMDAEAYPEASKGVVQIIWDVVTSNQDIQWAKARISAVEALTQYEVSQLEKSIPDFKKRNLELFFSEKNPEVLKVMEDCQVKIVTDEHINRRRLVKEKRVTTGSKIEKLMAVFPQVIFSSGKVKEARELPGAALLCFTLTHKDVDELPASKRVRDVHAGYENALVEIASSLQLSRNILLALVAFQSWKGFMRRWMKAYIQSYDAKAQSGVQDTTSKAASNILKSLVAIADEAIPRAAENIALAIGALCVVLPPSVHTVKSAASKFLLEWLLQHEHEHRQWSSAISLGLISSCLHVTDHRQRYHNITGLLEVLFVSKSSLVKGACGVGLGFSCQDLLTRVEAADDSAVEKETDKVPESELLGRIVRALATMLHDRTQSSSDVLDSLSSCFPLDSYDMNAEVFEPFSENNEDLEEDIWGVAGLVLGLATSISAIYRAGELEAVIKIKKLVISWLPYANSLLQGTNFLGEESNTVLAIGSCIALPTIVTFCQRMELMDGIELDNIVAGFKELISELISVKKSGILHQSLLMASCVGAGTVISCILNEGVHSIEVDCVNGLLELFKKCYSNPFPSLVHLGGMLGAVNAMGAGAGILAYMNFPNYTKHSCYEKKEYSSVTGPLLTISVFEPYLTSLVQEMFLVAQNSDHHQLQQFASWALSFLRQHLWSKEHLSVDGDSNVAETNSKSVSHSFSEENMVLKLSLWLMDIKYTEPGSTVHVSTVIATLRCLCRAPRLPNLDWGAIIRRCMRHEAKFAELPPVYSAFKKGTLREECIQFALAHASQFDSLLNFLDELSDFSRFKTLELNLQSCLLIHLADLAKVYSSSRLEKLFGDVTNHLSSFTSYDELKSLLCISCWKGLYECLHEVSVDTSDHIAHVERCMQALFTLLPVMQSSDVVVSGDVSSIEEWSEAIKCLGKAPQSWLLDFLKVSHYEFGQSADDAVEIQKKVCAKIKLVKAGSLPLIELGKMKSYILNSKAQVFVGLWDVLVEVVAALHHAEGSVKRQWLIDAVEISCVSAVPSTALQFLGLLSATCCKYMPFMIVDQQKVLNDLPVTLVSLLEDKNWENAAETIVSHLFSSTERIYHWAMQIEDGSYVPDSQPIDESENHMAAFLLQVLHHTCVLLKSFLPLDKQLRLASMVID